MSVHRLYPSGSRHGRLAHEIGRQIVSGALAEGATLPSESDLARHNGISRQAVREGLKVLGAKGLITTRKKVGSTVIPRRSWNLLDPDVLDWHGPARLPAGFLTELIELRRLIEPQAAALSAARRSNEQLDRIQSALHAMYEAQNEPDRFAADVEFHAAIFAASGNSLIDRLSRILGPMLRASFETQGNLAPSLEAALEMHRVVYDGIAAGDPDHARSAMETMLATADSGIRAKAEDGVIRDRGMPDDKEA